ncbi:SGT1-domain-containing protein [Viridothelium virens]|uniref:SGT1-domain-containing protein n=1 Tax=Viridothelium virens TaxID=1048519 RepID=A0A6A6HHN2_VIRVR|nr:SGT1-domain-containing protein [Viridothelium virens]
MSFFEDSNFEAFRERWNGVSRHLPEDCVQYAIYIINERLDNAHQRLHVQEINSAAKELRKKYSQDYIWQEEEFSLNLIHNEGRWILQGKTNFGDCIADEWLIAWILRELSKKFEDAWIRLYDTQGEFLFIEAAKALPKWLNPEIGRNRAWINSGRLIVIPLQESHAPKSLTTAEALSLISSPYFQLIHSRSMEAEAFRRLSNYPQEIQNNNHRAIVTIPRKLAHLLRKNPLYIAPAVEAFYLRDPISLKHLQNPNPSTLRFPPRDLVTVSVRFTKFLYAQIQSQQFAAPPTWATAIPSILTAAGKEKTEWGQQNAKALSRAEMGMKVTSGFEMVLQDAQFRGRKKVQEMQVLLEDVESGEEELPNDEEIKGWEMKQDDETWLDVDFREFQEELEGKKSKDWGDKGAQNNLRDIVKSFKHFMDDEGAGVEGAGDMMDDDDEDEPSDGGSETDDSFDSERFQKSMETFRQMPAEERPKALAKDMEKLLQELGDEDLIEGDEEDDEMRNIMNGMEKELNKAGALKLNPQDSDAKQVGNSKGYGNGRSSRIKELEKAEEEDEDMDESSDDAEENDIDYNLAKNMMDAFKAQSGMSGPAGNMLAQMGIQLPRDEVDEE